MTIKLRDYLARNERTYNYRIKAVIPLNDAVMDVIERLLARYNPIKIGRQERTIFHKNPLDFPNVQGAEVFSIDITLGLPISGYAVGMEITRALQIPDKFVIIRGDNDPTELETQRLNAGEEMDQEAEKEGLTREALLDSPTYEEVDSKPGDEYYGDKYNGKLLGYLKKVEDERAEAAIKPPKPFEYLVPTDATQPNDFNDGHGPKAATTGRDRPLETGPNGSLEDVRRLAKRLYRNAKGETKVKTK
jgi:hypothetical protein